MRLLALLLLAAAGAAVASPPASAASPASASTSTTTSTSSAPTAHHPPAPVAGVLLDALLQGGAGGQQAYAALVERCRADLFHNTGVCHLPGFLTSTSGQRTRQRLLAELVGADMQISVKSHTVTQQPVDPSRPPDHPRNLRVDAKIGFVGRRLLPANSELEKLYDWPPLLEFLSRVTQRPLFRSADIDGSVYGIRNGVGFTTAWHIDQHPFSAVLVLQQSGGGGAFDFVPNITQSLPAGGGGGGGGGEARCADETDDETTATTCADSGSRDAPIYERAARVIRGDAAYYSLRAQPGDLVFFNGATTMHQVANVTADPPRVVSVFTFAEVPNFSNSGLVRQQNTWDKDGM